MLVTDWYVTNMSKNATNVIFCHQHNDVTNITVINNLEETILIIKNVIFMKNGHFLTKTATFWRKKRLLNTDKRKLYPYQSYHLFSTKIQNGNFWK